MRDPYSVGATPNLRNAMRALLAATALLLVTPALAQEPEPDTTDWHLYIPLAIGNEWQYRHDWGIFPPDEFEAFQVVGDSLVDGTPYFTVERCTRLVSELEPTCDEQSHLIRYEEAAAVLVERLLVDGEPRLEMWPRSASGFIDYLTCAGLPGHLV